MGDIVRVPPQEAHRRMVEEEYSYVDVRSPQEWVQGHPEGSLNIPVAFFDPARGMVPNPDFVQAFQAHFGLDDKVVVGCKTGGRSFRAVGMLQNAGFTHCVDMAGGFYGEADPATGGMAVAGWKDEGLPVATGSTPGADWDSLSPE